jgi:hypothetical protein
MDQKEQLEILLATGKTMFFIWLNNLFMKKYAKFDEDNSNIIILEPYPSTWFCIGREENSKTPFIGIQENMIPWFLETPWERAVVDEQGGYLYLTCAESGGVEDLTLAIRTRVKRLKVFTHDKKSEDESILEFRIIKVRPNNEVEISEKVYKRCSLEYFKSKREIVMPSADDFMREAEVLDKGQFKSGDDEGGFSSVQFEDED